MMALLAAPFFAAIYMDGGKATMLVAVIVGAIQSVLSKATKYALFDPTTQMAYIPLDEESKVGRDLL
jgi:ATP:ADP antiporter, AAA family